MIDSNGNQELTVFYDGGCPVCSREIAHYRRLPAEQPIRWVDITGAAAEELDRVGLTPLEAMKIFHVQDADGVMHRGIPAFLTLWQTLPRYRWLAALTRRLHLSALLDFAYRYFLAWHERRRCQNGVCR